MVAPKKSNVKDRAIKIWEQIVKICEFAERHPLVGCLIKLLFDLFKWWWLPKR